MKILIRSIVSFFVFIVDVVYGNRPYPRFYLLETIARVPYFSFLSLLHLYETLGFWRKVDWLKVHFAETWNELHHLLINNDSTATTSSAANFSQSPYCCRTDACA